jgi:hypothetical protein
MKVGIQKIRNILKESAFDPNKEVGFKIVIDMDDPSYALCKAIELCTEAKTASQAKRQKNIKQAISLLSLARLMEDGTAKVQK